MASLSVFASLRLMGLACCVSYGAERIAEGPAKFEGNVFANEGPSWDGKGFLYFTAKDRISRRDTAGKVEVVQMHPGQPNGLLIDPAGRMIVCEGGARRVTRTERDGSVTVLAERFEGKRLNSPNDVAVDPKGRIYFTDPRYRDRETMEIRDPDGKLVEGVYRIDAPGKVTRILTHEVQRPNGILITPDGHHLYIADHNRDLGGARKLWRFTLDGDGAIVRESQKLIFDWGTERGPDGLKMDRNGLLYVTAGGIKANPPAETLDRYRSGVYIISPEGKLLETVEVGNPVTNCAFGDPDLRTLYITAAGALWSVRVHTPGVVSAK